MQSALITLGIIDVLVVLAVVLLVKPDLGRQRLDRLYGAQDPRCTSCGDPTNYRAPLCPKCARRLREAQSAQAEGREVIDTGSGQRQQ